MDTLMETALADGKYVAYTDGSARPNPGPSAYAYRILKQDQKPVEKVGTSHYATNNVAEFYGILRAIEAVPEGAEIVICSDSNYIIDNYKRHLQGWIKRGWRKSGGKDVLNRDLWEKLIALMETHTVTFHKVKAHSGDPDNERVDTLAGLGADRAGRQIIEALKRGK